ncbi:MULTISPECIES: ComEA family DNA-binding protein [Providencia]|uniref:Helix-hairpin-helix domain-containing protein n=1 Tax=Providencia manganoxydans TaxID=2923283 RepID=A0ABX7AHG4_9GAMM|nr:MULTISPECIES: ComEA family DNA-binding protein [Providencia]MDX4945584.1 ComEA family DNA-binding protein [Providencia manganoxydans]QQO63165.1 helix-hairpin-helix domain-containing protein [Providencia manganoxydans]HEF8773076.1 helix-hairpin-helix domain-containing protein [Providencia stuartii]
MSWMQLTKQFLGSVVIIFSMLMYQQQALAKKTETEKPSLAVTNQTSQQVVDATHSSSTHQVNINQASAEELAKKLSGIGIQKAKAIVEYRDKYGAFSSLENILEVKGIGPSFLEKNRSKLTL